MDNRYYASFGSNVFQPNKWLFFFKLFARQSSVILIILSAFWLPACSKPAITKVSLTPVFLVKKDYERKIQKDVLIVMDQELSELVMKAKVGNNIHEFNAGQTIRLVLSDALQSFFQKVHFSNNLSNQDGIYDYLLVVELKGYDIRLSKTIIGKHVVNLYFKYSFLDSNSDLLFTTLCESRGVEDTEMKSVLRSETPKALDYALKYAPVADAVFSQYMVQGIVRGVYDALRRSWDWALTNSIAKFMLDLEKYYLQIEPDEEGQATPIQTNIGNNIQCQISPNITNWIYMLKSENPITKLLAAQTTYKIYSNYSDILEAIQSELFKKYKSDIDDKYYLKSLGWMCYTLGRSSKTKYINTLVEIAQGAQNEELRKVAKKTLKEFFNLKEPYEQSYSDKVSFIEMVQDNGCLQEEQLSDATILINMLTGENSETKYIAAKLVYKHYMENPEIDRILRVVFEELEKGFQTNLDDPFQVHAVAWMCAILGESGEIKYKALLEQIESKTNTRKIKKAAHKGKKKLE